VVAGRSAEALLDVQATSPAPAAGPAGPVQRKQFQVGTSHTTYRSEELAGLPWLESLPNEKKDEWRAALGSALKDGKLTPTEKTDLTTALQRLKSGGSGEDTKESHSLTKVEPVPVDSSMGGEYLGVGGMLDYPLLGRLLRSVAEGAQYERNTVNALINLGMLGVHYLKGEGGELEKDLQAAIAAVGRSGYGPDNSILDKTQDIGPEMPHPGLAKSDGTTASAGQFSVGILAVPSMSARRKGQMATTLVGSPSLEAWGHTACYVRWNGQIVIVRGFGPNMVDAVQHASAIESGKKAVPGEFTDDAGMLEQVNAMSVEWPCAKEAAALLMKRLASLSSKDASQLLYSARPNTYKKDSLSSAKDTATSSLKQPEAMNCVLWAFDQIEQTIGKEGERILDPESQTPVTGLATQKGDSDSKDRKGGQGPLMGFLGRMQRMQDTKQQSKMPVPSGASGPPVVGSMPQGLRMLKVGSHAVVGTTALLGNVGVLATTGSLILSTFQSLAGVNVLPAAVVWCGSPLFAIGGLLALGGGLSLLGGINSYLPSMRGWLTSQEKDKKPTDKKDD
jgi:hypothetical protein